MSKVRQIAFTVLLLSFASVSACGRSDAGSSAAPAAVPVAANPVAGGDQTPTLAEVDRKVIKSATLTLVVGSPAAALVEARAVAERHGGYLSNTSNSGSRDAGAESESVVVSLKVRADQFDAALDELRRLGSGSAAESIESTDVTEEYVDLDARLRAQKRVEGQYLALLERAKNVAETLEIHKQLTLVRTEIERLEGRRLVLEHQVRLSTIKVTFEKQRPLLAIGGGRFTRAVRDAGADVVNVGAAIVIASIRAAGVLIPFGVLVLLPAALILRWGMRRRMQRRTVAAA
jgi:hypothetical protein